MLFNSKQSLLSVFFCILLSRLVLFTVFAQFVSFNEISNDASQHIFLANNALDYLTGTAQVYTHHVPLLPTLLFAIITPFKAFGLSDFVSLRLSFVLTEAAAWTVFFHATVETLGDKHGKKGLLFLLMLIPIGWMTSVVMPQDEVLALLFVALTIWAIIHKRFSLARTILGIGAVSTKIFLVLPLAVLVLNTSDKPLVKRCIEGGAAFVTILGFAYFLSMVNHNSPPQILSSAPDNFSTVNIWVFVLDWFNLDFETAKRISTWPFMFAGLVPALFAFYKGYQLSGLTLIMLMGHVLAWFFAGVYLVVAEYLIIVVPFFLLSFPSVKGQSIAMAIYSLPWAINFFEGVMKAQTGTSFSGKTAFVSAYENILPHVSPNVPYTLLVYLWSVSAFVVAFAMTTKLIRAMQSCEHVQTGHNI